MAAAAARCLLVGRSLLSPLVPGLDNSRNATPSPLPSISASSLFDSSNLPSCKNFTYSRIYAPPRRSSSDLHESNPGQGFALLLEVEGVVADIYRLGNRQAFNTAFQKLGLDCANWTEPIYTDLMRKAAGDEKRMLILFFNRIGWPSSLPTNEKETFTKNILREKKKGLEDFATSSSLTLRPGVGKCTCSAANSLQQIWGESMQMQNQMKKLKFCLNLPSDSFRSIIDKLGQERLQKVIVVGKEEVKNSLYGQLVLGKGASSSLDERLAKEVRKAASMEKQRIAHDVASILKLSVDIDTSSSESFENIIATLRAGAEYAGLPVQNCVLIAGSQPGVYGSERVGMPCVVMRSGSTARAEFRSAKAVMDAFGGADLTVAKLLSKKWY